MNAKNNASRQTGSDSSSIHKRLYELHSLDQKKRQKNEAQRLSNVLLNLYSSLFLALSHS